MPLVGDRTTFVQRAYGERDDEFRAVYTFSDISVRQDGLYRLQFVIFEILGDQVYPLTSIDSLPFRTYSAKNFPGMQPSTETTCGLKQGGVRMRMKKAIRVNSRVKFLTEVTFFESLEIMLIGLTAKETGSISIC